MPEKRRLKRSTIGQGPNHSVSRSRAISSRSYIGRAAQARRPNYCNHAWPDFPLVRASMWLKFSQEICASVCVRDFWKKQSLARSRNRWIRSRRRTCCWAILAQPQCSLPKSNWIVRNCRSFARSSACLRLPNQQLRQSGNGLLMPRLLRLTRPLQFSPKINSMGSAHSFIAAQRESKFIRAIYGASLINSRNWRSKRGNSNGN